MLKFTIFIIMMASAYLLLYRTVGDSRMMQFFGQNFTQTRWKKAALKNAYALLSKQRYEHAAAFFLLGDKLWDACEVCVARLEDIQLALVIARLYEEGDGGPIYNRILKEIILGLDTTSGKGDRRSKHFDPNPDPFLHSIAYWLLQDYSAALETLLVPPVLSSVSESGSIEEEAKPLNPAIFNFYFFLRSHPLLIRRNQHNYKTMHKRAAVRPSLSPHSLVTVRPNQQPLSSVGEEPLTPLERSLLFSTAYHHLNHGCPLLALDVLSKLPKSSNLGADLNTSHQQQQQQVDVNKDTHLGGIGVAAPAKVKVSLTGMIQSGTLGEFGFGLGGGGQGDEDMDWSQPVSRGALHEEEEEFDWSKPITSQMLGNGGIGEEEDEFDWSKPVSTLSRPLFNSDEPAPQPPTESDHPDSEGDENGPSLMSSFTLSSQGLFILSLAEQLQYNACLSILTEELITIFLPSCCEFLWNSKGKESLPLLPLTKQPNEKCLASHHKENAFEKTVLSLRGMLVVWLRREMATVKEICGFETSKEELEETTDIYVPAGYDLLTTLMNYASLHAGTSPTLITVKLELMHLMNTLLPWSTQSTRTEQDLEGGEGLVSLPSGIPTCAVDPSQLPILTSCSLPSKHLTNLSLHLRLMAASVIEVLANHTCPPISSKPLPNVAKVFELCCAISHSITACLSPMSFAEIASEVLTNISASSSSSTPASGMATPIIPANASQGELTVAYSPGGLHLKAFPHMQQQQTRPRSGGSFSFTCDMLAALGTPNTRPSKWPGIEKWPKALQSDEGKDPTPLSLILAECCIAVYVGLLSIAWSWHSLSDLLLLLKSSPSQAFWYQAFGGGIDMKVPGERGRRGGGGVSEKSALMQKMDSMTKRIKKLRKTSQGEETAAFELFVAPQRTLLDLFLCHDVSHITHKTCYI